MNTHAAREASALSEQSDVPDWHELFDAHFRSMTALAMFLGADDPEDIASEGLPDCLSADIG